MTLSAIVDARNATDRLYHVFVAETTGDEQQQDAHMEAAIEIIDAIFTWDSAPPEVSSKKAPRTSKGKSEVIVTENAVDVKQEMVFSMRGINMTMPRGQLTAIVGMLIGLIGFNIPYMFTRRRSCRIWQDVTSRRSHRRNEADSGSSQVCHGHESSCVKLLIEFFKQIQWVHRILSPERLDTGQLRIRGLTCQTLTFFLLEECYCP